eukprot:scaffold3449_cov339-Prasinococcus_capsulatus_cf.AAC.2
MSDSSSACTVRRRARGGGGGGAAAAGACVRAHADAARAGPSLRYLGRGPRPRGAQCTRASHRGGRPAAGFRVRRDAPCPALAALAAGCFPS